MTTAVDTSVLLDILLDDPVFGKASEEALRQARLRGRLVVGETVVAELGPILASADEVAEFLADNGLEFVASSQQAAHLAGTTFKAYLRNRGTSKRVVPDFLVAAHARFCADCLLARDRGYDREYFRDLQVQEP